MKISTHPIRIAILGAFVTSLHAKDPVLTTPGSATWTKEATATGGTRTVFTLTKNTVFNWEQLNLESGSEMVFNFTGGKTVVNFLGGTNVHAINGSVTSNGIVAFFSPTATLEVNGSILAKGVTLATMNADASDFSSGNGYKLSGKGAFNYLNINGKVEATDGDVVIAGERVVIGDSATLKASQDILIGGGREISVAGSGDRRLKEEGGFGYVLHMGDSRASRIEVAAGRSIKNQGTLNSGNGRIFLEVGNNGKITNESTGIIVGDAVFNGNFDNTGKILGMDEGDAAPAVGESYLTVPKLTRPDGSSVSSAPQTIGYSVPVSASGDAGRDSGTANSALAANDSNSSGSSFSGTRGAFGTTSTQTVSYSAPKSAAINSSGESYASASAAANESIVSSGTTKVRAAARKDSYTVPVSASRSTGKSPTYTERAAQNSGSKSLLRRASFFGMRGGSTTITKR